MGMGLGRRTVALWAALVGGLLVGCAENSQGSQDPDGGDKVHTDVGPVDSSAPDTRSDTPDTNEPQPDAATPDATNPTDSGPTVDDTGPLSHCGPCPDGYTCGSANGLPVCRAPSGVPLFSHVFVVLMENTSLPRLAHSTNTPFIHGLFEDYASANDYNGVTHPSLANYIALTSGDTWSIGCDCAPTGSSCNFLTCNDVVHNCGCGQAETHIGDQLEAIGATWRDYAEDIHDGCDVSSHGEYAPRHVPFLYYQNVQTDTTRCTTHIVNHDVLATDLASAATTPTFSFISPNLVHDMHDPVPAGAANLANGDAWLSTEVPLIMGSDAYRNGGLLVIVWDEDDYSLFGGADDPIPMILISPYARSGGFTTSTTLNHYNLLATFQDGLGLARLARAMSADALTEFFPDS